MSYTRFVSQALDSASDLLSTVTDSSRLESEILLAQILECSRVFLRAHPEYALTEDQANQYKVNVGRRINGEPLPYITGKIEFFGLSFRVTPDVLIPRPETEMLVEQASQWIAEHSEAVVLDVGTGSGCIAIALAYHTQCHRIIATDISFAALRIAQNNAALHRVRNKIGFINCDLIRPFRGPVDVIISNPPYIADSEWASLPQTVHHEPRKALLAGEDGMHIVRRLLHLAHELIHPRGLVLIEIGAQQGNTALMVARMEFPDATIRILKDLAGLDRVISIQC